MSAVLTDNGTDHGAGSVQRDPTLPLLPTLLDTRAMAGHLAAYWPGHSLLRADLIRHKLGRRALIRYTASGSDSAIAYGKTFASERGPRVHRIAEKVYDLTLSGELPFRVAPPIAWIPDLRLSLVGAVSGDGVEPRILASDTVLARQIAQALAALHGSALSLDRHHELSDELAPLAGRVEALSQRAPQLMRQAHACLHRVHQRVPVWERRWRSRPIHRDCYHEQWLLDPDGLALLDFDDAKIGEPAVDIANVTAHLHLLALQLGRPVSSLNPVVDAFNDAASAADPDLPSDLVRALEAATLLRLADIHQPRANGDAVAQALLDLCEERLESQS